MSMTHQSKADMDPSLISPAAFKQAWGCSISRPAQILNMMPHLWAAEGVRTGMDAAPQAWTQGKGNAAQRKALEAAVRRSGSVDPLLVDAMALPLRAHRQVLKALGWVLPKNHPTGAAK